LHPQLQLKSTSSVKYRRGAFAICDEEKWEIGDTWTLALDLLGTIITFTYQILISPQKASQLYRGLTVPVDGEKTGSEYGARVPSAGS
jgi:hypothetical protein